MLPMAMVSVTLATMIACTTKRWTHGNLCESLIGDQPGQHYSAWTWAQQDVGGVERKPSLADSGQEMGTRGYLWLERLKALPSKAWQVCILPRLKCRGK